MTGRSTTGRFRAGLMVVALLAAAIPVVGVERAGAAGPDLAVTVAGPEQAFVSTPLAYKVTVQNNGTAATGGAKLTVRLTGEVTGVGGPSAGAGEPGFTCAAAQRAGSTWLMTCTSGSLAPGASRNVTVTATAPATVPATATRMSASIEGTGSAADANLDDNSGRVVTTILPLPVLVVGEVHIAELRPDLRVEMHAASAYVNPGAVVGYELTVRNDGPAATSGAVKVKVTLPQGTAYRQSGGDYPFVCGHAAGMVTCSTNSALTAGSSFYLFIDVTAPSAAGPLVATAAVDPDALITESSEQNNTATATVTVTGRPDLVASATGSDWEMEVGQQQCMQFLWDWTRMTCNSSVAGATVRVTLRNRGPGTVHGGRVRIALTTIEKARFVRSEEVCPAGTALADGNCGFDPSVGAGCSVSATAAVCATDRVLAPGQGETFVLNIGLTTDDRGLPVVSPGIPVAVVITADPDGEVDESNEQNNIAGFTIRAGA